LKNGDFASGLDPWSSYVHFDASANLSVVDEKLNLNIENAGNEAWSVLVEQGNLNLGLGLTYELSFDARSTVARNMEVTLENAEYHRYLSQSIAVDDVMETYSFDFVMSANDVASLKFLMGNFDGAHEITIDNVVLRVKDAGVEN
jgi:Carbohydrate binding domain